MKFACPCCQYLTYDIPIDGTFIICPVCYWEDDNVQLDDPDYAGGANKVSLNMARENFKQFGASNILFVKFVRPPNLDEIPST